MATASATGGAPLVVVKESGAKGESGTDGTDGAGFNQVRQSKLDNPLLHLFKTNQLSAVSAPLNTDADVTWTRASAATFEDRYGVIQSAAIDVPREEKEGFLFEGASTNVLLRSEEFDNAAWSKTSVTVTANDTTAPDGTTTADKLDMTTSNSFAFQTFATTSTSTSFTVSFFVKKISGTFDGTNLAIQIDGDVVSNGQIIIDNLINSTTFTRVSTTITTDGSPTSIRAVLITNTATCIVHAWGAQLEESLSFATSYIKTTTASVTRSKDSVSVVGENNIPPLDGDQSYSYKFNLLGLSGTQIIFGTTGVIGNILTRVDSAGLIQVVQNTANNYSTYVSGIVDVALTYNASLESFYFNGTLNSSNGVTLGAFNDSAFFFGTFDGTFNPMFGHIKDFRTYDFSLNVDEVTYLAGL